MFFTKNFPGRSSRSLIRFKKALLDQKVSEFIVKGLFTPTKKHSCNWYKRVAWHCIALHSLQTRTSEFHLWNAACF